MSRFRLSVQKTFLTLCRHKESPESAFYGSLAGTVIGVPYANNLKIRPEFFPLNYQQCLRLAQPRISHSFVADKEKPLPEERF